MLGYRIDITVTSWGIYRIMAANYEDMVGDMAESRV